MAKPEEVSISDITAEKATAALSQMVDHQIKYVVTMLSVFLSCRSVASYFNKINRLCAAAITHRCG